MPGANGRKRNAGVVKLADTQDLGSCGETRGGSSPSARTMLRQLLRTCLYGPNLKAENHYASD
jgi:hypothetical protein